MASGEIFGIVVMLVGACVGIVFLDFIAREFATMLREQAEADRAEGTKTGAEMAGGEAAQTGAGLLTEQSHSVGPRTGREA